MWHPAWPHFQAWKREADFVLPRSSFSTADLVAWRRTLDFEGPVFAGVMVLPSAVMARKLSTDVPQLAVPGPIIRCWSVTAMPEWTSPASSSMRSANRRRSTACI